MLSLKQLRKFLVIEMQPAGRLVPIMIACHDSYRPPISFRDKCVLEIAPFPGFDLSVKWTLEGKTVLGGVGVGLGWGWVGGGGRTQRENPCSATLYFVQGNHH